ncbi:MAG: DUF3800 domain-containing protein [Rickettsiales bacterium]|jgi:hypothetical protein|nr:DUF3800 domain-containing protein [Rickettsiales bacterium]
MKNSNYLVFVDESGDQNLRTLNPNGYPMFVLAFMIIEKSEYCNKLLPKFAALKLKYFPDVNTIFHEVDIRKQVKQFEFLRNASARESFMSDMNQLMSEIQYKVIAVAFDKAVPKNLPDDLYESAVKFGLSAIKSYLQELNDFNYTTITFESRAYSLYEYRDVDKKLYDYFKQIAEKEFGISIQVKSAGGYGLQFADLIARPIGIHLLKPGQPNRAWNIIETKLGDNGLIVLPRE